MGHPLHNMWYKNAGSGQVTELWRNTGYGFRPIFSGTVLWVTWIVPIDMNGTLCMIKVRTWPHLASDIALRPFEGQTRSLTLTDPIRVTSPLTQFALRRFFWWWWRCSHRGCDASQILDPDTVATHHFVQNWTWNSLVIVTCRYGR